MGDRKRGRVLATYIRKRFPKRIRILSVADGDLILAKELAGDYDLVVIDPKIRSKSGARDQIKVIGKYFYSADHYYVDLIVGLHPDEATGEIVDFAILNNKPCIIVPCCQKGKYSSECTKDWTKFLANKLIQKGFDTTIDQLKISGANTVIFAIPKWSA